MALSRSRRGDFRAYYLTLVICIAAFMQGYDSGVAGGILTFKPFLADFHYSAAQKTRVNALTVGLQQLGAFLACFAIFPVADKLGRRRAVLISTCVFLVGAVLQTVNTGTLSAWYVARVVAGLGQGGCSVVVPTYSAEMAPKEIRGRLGSLYQWMHALGISTSYWVDYGVVRGISDTNSAQWQLPVGLQAAWGLLLLAGIFTLKESPRWLIKKGRPEEARANLAWLRASTAEHTADEFDALKAGIEDEFAAREGFRVRELFEPANRRRFALGSATFLFQQGTGSTALAYFGPQFFQLLVGPGDQDILLTGLFGAVKLVACSCFILFVAEVFGRRPLMAGGALMMASCMLPTALVYKYHPPVEGGPVTSANKATVALVFINIAFYNLSWGPIPWAYVPEIFPTRIREVGVAVSVAVHWLFSFVFSISTPYMIRDMGWGMFLFYAVLDVFMAAFCWLFIKETRGKTLEGVQQEIDHDSYGVNAKPGTEEQDGASSRARRRHQ